MWYTVDSTVHKYMGLKGFDFAGFVSECNPSYRLGRLVKQLGYEIHGTFIDATSDEIWASFDATEGVLV